MSKADILSKLKQAIIDLEEDEVPKLLQDGLKAGVSPMEMITDGMNPGLSEIGYGFEHGQRFMNDLVIAGEIMNESMKILRPALESGTHGKGAGDVMVIGTVQGDTHNIGKRIVAAMFSGAGYRVVDIGENLAASVFVKAAKENKAVLVGASAILGNTKPYCKVINDALIDAGLRDNVIYIIGGWGMTQEWSDRVGADACGDNAVDAVAKVKAIRAGEIRKLKDRQKQ